MERVQVVHPSKETTETSSLSLCRASRLHSSPQLIAAAQRLSFSNSPASSAPRNRPSSRFGSDAGAVMYAARTAAGGAGAERRRRERGRKGSRRGEKAEEKERSGGGRLKIGERGRHGMGTAAAAMEAPV